MPDRQLPPARSVIVNPEPAEMRELALRYQDRITITEFGNLAYQSETTSRLNSSTFFVSDNEIHKNRISRQEASLWARRQDEYIRRRDMIRLDGYIGPDPEFRTGCRLYVEATHANLPAMQRHLYFPPDSDWSAEFQVIYTPGLRAPGMPAERLITIDLETSTTRVLGSDYFGESKMGGLRMWNKLVYDRGGLALHAGLKTFPAAATRSGEEESMLIIGLSGTGKTTTTFRRQLGSLPVQDDFVALMSGGTVFTSENGCFAKTFGLDPLVEPAIYAGATAEDAWLENVSVDPDGKVDFFDPAYTTNGRCTFPLANIEHRSPLGVPPARYLLILNRSQSIIPAVARLDRRQAAAYFMLGETMGTSAGGAAEAGKSLRVPGTNPFFFDDDAMQGNRFLDLIESMPDLGVFLLNTGRVGGPEEDARSLNIRIADSSAVVSGIVDGSIEWVDDPDFGYQVAASVPGVDGGVLRPALHYRAQGRGAEYAEAVDRLRRERESYLAGFGRLREEIVAGLTG
jgi:phosphoenolpyruvate carboxykinase (ATP)